MSIQVKNSSMVRPAEKTPHHKLWLSSLDLVIRPVNTHTPSMHIYKHTSPNDDYNNDNAHKFFDTHILKQSLSQSLVPFYPLAGRLTKDESGRLEIDCNEEGALFIEAETQYSLDDFDENGLFTPTDKLYEMLIPRCDYSKGVSAFPLLMVQLTRFKCGGVSVGFAQHHQLGDGMAYVYFLISWARIARGLELECLPVVDRVPYLAPRCPPQVEFHHLEYDPPVSLLDDSQLETSTTMAAICKLSKAQIEALKLKATSSVEENGYNTKLTTFQVLAGHVWRTATKARGLSGDQDVKLLIPVDGRSRLGLPKGFFGNVIFQAACIAKAGEIACKPLGYAASKVQKAVRKMNQEYLRSAIDHLESQPDITALARGGHTYGCPNLVVNSWVNLAHHEVDYGWGRPIFGGSGGIRCEGQCFILQSPDRDGSLLVTAKLFTHHMTLFKDYLYDF